MKLDNIHWSGNKLLSYNKPFNFVVSAREAGKTTWIWHWRYNTFKSSKKSTLVIRRRIADITETYVHDIESVINKFEDEPIKLVFKKGSISEGIVDVRVEGTDEIFFRVIGLSNPMMRIKSLMLANLGCIIYDEFICNTKLGEKYLENETFKFSELYNTFQRECEGTLRCVFMGNPYSIYNPYFAWIGVALKKLYPGSFTTGSNYVVECYELTPELKEHILNKNPLYQFDEAYKSYAFDGRSINDKYIKIVDQQPENFKLKFVFYVENKFVGVYWNDGCSDWSTQDVFYWVKCLPDYSSNRRVVDCFDISMLIEGTNLISTADKLRFAHLKQAFRCRKIGFKSAEEEYLIEEVYDLI